MADEVRKWYVGQALRSYKSLNEVISELTEQEVYAALNLEAATQRRKTVVDRLISRAARLNEIVFTRQLKEKYHGKS